MFAVPPPLGTIRAVLWNTRLARPGLASGVDPSLVVARLYPLPERGGEFVLTSRLQRFGDDADEQFRRGAVGRLGEGLQRGDGNPAVEVDRAFREPVIEGELEDKGGPAHDRGLVVAATDCLTDGGLLVGDVLGQCLVKPADELVEDAGAALVQRDGDGTAGVVVVGDLSREAVLAGDSVFGDEPAGDVRITLVDAHQAVQGLANAVATVGVDVLVNDPRGCRPVAGEEPEDLDLGGFEIDVSDP